MPKYAKKKKKQKSRILPVMLTVIGILAVLLCAMLFLKPETEVAPDDTQTTADTDPLETEDLVTEPEKTETPSAPAEQENQDATAATEEIPAETEKPELQFPVVLQDGLQINSINKYAGLYMEDGSDEVVSGILMIELENTSGEDLHLAQILLHYADVTAEFQVTNLPAHKKVVLLELNRMDYVAEMPDSAEAVNVAFVEKFTMYEDKLEINALNGVINVRNISGEDIDQDIYVYYKNTAGDLYYGGITYRVRIEGGLKKDEIRQLMASHFNEKTCQLLMVTIGG